MDIWRTITSDVSEIQDILYYRDYFKKSLKKGGKIFVWGEEFFKHTLRQDRKEKLEWNNFLTKNCEIRR
jgi:hypothetical protein